MVNKNLFSKSSTLPAANTLNAAGGIAYSLSAENALAQYAVTGTFNNTYYASDTEQLDKILEFAQQCDSEYVAKLAVYARQKNMKDTPALLLNVLANRGEDGLSFLRRIFHTVVNNSKMLRNFITILESGKCGRKSMGTAVKNLVREWFYKRNAADIFYDSVGQSPSIPQIIRKAHVKPQSQEQDALFKWFLGREHNFNYLPEVVQQFEFFKKDQTAEVPKIEFRMLTALNLSKSQWKEIARNATWNQLRMNLNTFVRHDVFADKSILESSVEKLRNPELIRRNNAFPYQLLTTYQNTLSKVPVELSNTLQEAMEIATENVPEIRGAAVCVDTSGSMRSPVTGYRAGSTSATRCVDVAALFASCLLRKNKNTKVIPFDTQVHESNLNPFDSVMTNAALLAGFGGGGTSCESALRYLNQENWNGNVVIFISDNESWLKTSYADSVPHFMRNHYANSSTGLMNEWSVFKKKNPKAKLVCVDIQAEASTQAPDSKDILTIGGWSDSVFSVVDNFVNGDDRRDFAEIVRQTPLSD
jgi:60 kDa SS-A/Ro ribonucleoprotein